MASLLDATIGAATELDRAMGYEANASGTSYLDQPLDMLGSYRVGSPLVNVSANRSLVGGAATVQWDDESVVPDEFTLVKHGTLVDFQTTREQVAWIAPYYTKNNRPLRSHGCAGADSALSVTMQHTPNLQLLPGASDTSFAELVASVKKGVAVMSIDPNMDQQQLNGLGYGAVRKIVNGKLGPYINGAGVQFRSSEIWKNVAALGGAKELRWFGMARRKGEPFQSTTHSVGAVPARINTVDIIDVARKA
jgi:TldD protein